MSVIAHASVIHSDDWLLRGQARSYEEADELLEMTSETPAPHSSAAGNRTASPPTNEDMELEVMNDNRVLFIGRRGSIHLYDPIKGSSSKIAQLEVFSVKRLKRIMLFVLLIGLVTSAWADTIQPDKNGVVSGGGWNFTKSDLRAYPGSPPIEQVQESGGFRRLRGWIEYEFETPASGWYSLWLAGIGETHNRDLFIDGG